MSTGTLTLEHYGWFELDNADCDAVSQVSGSSEDNPLSSRGTGVGNAFILRIQGYESTSANDTIETFKLQASYDGGAAFDVTNASNYVQVYEAGDGNPITDNVTQTNLLTAGSGTDWFDGEVDLTDGDVAVPSSIAFPKDDWSEWGWCVFFVHSQVADGIDVDFTWVVSGCNFADFGTAPSVTISKPAVVDYPQLHRINPVYAPLVRM